MAGRKPAIKNDCIRKKIERKIENRKMFDGTDSWI